MGGSAEQLFFASVYMTERKVDACPFTLIAAISACGWRRAGQGHVPARFGNAILGWIECVIFQCHNQRLGLGL